MTAISLRFEPIISQEQLDLFSRLVSDPILFGYHLQALQGYYPSSFRAHEQSFRVRCFRQLADFEDLLIKNDLNFILIYVMLHPKLHF